jgi:hypothetical protein
MEHIEEIDLRTIISHLVGQFPEIEDVYIFGSRRYNWEGSIRSDVDILIVGSGSVRTGSGPADPGFRYVHRVFTV